MGSLELFNTIYDNNGLGTNDCLCFLTNWQYTKLFGQYLTTGKTAYFLFAPALVGIDYTLGFEDIMNTLLLIDSKGYYYNPYLVLFIYDEKKLP